MNVAFEEFRDSSDDEAPLAAEVARLYGTEHSVRVVREAEFKADLPRILAAMDQPTIDGINTWFVSKAARERGLKVVLSGIGGDELFGGYPSFRDLPRWVGALRFPTQLPGLGYAFRRAYGVIAQFVGATNLKAAGLIEYGGSYPEPICCGAGCSCPGSFPGCSVRS